MWAKACMQHLEGKDPFLQLAFCRARKFSLSTWSSDVLEQNICSNFIIRAETC